MNNGTAYSFEDETQVHLLESLQEDSCTGSIMPTTLPSYLAEIDQSNTHGQNFEISERRSSPKHSIPHKKSGCCQQHSVFIVGAATLSALGGVLFGYDIGIISGALLQLRVDFCLSCKEREAVVSTMLGGAILASLTGGFLVDFFGRRVTIIVNCNIFILGAIFLAAAPSFAILIVGRIIVGYAVALSVIAECVYISEISPHKKRGMLVSLNELGIVVGFLVAFVVNFAFIQVDSGWRYMFGLSIIPAVIQGLGMCFLPASPRYLISKNREEEARQVLQMLHGNEIAEETLENIKAALKEEKSQSFLDLFKSQDNLRYRMFIAMGLVFLQQFTGQPNVLYYAPTIFQSIGFHSNAAATLASVGLGITKVVFCFLTLLLLDRIGRRKLLMTGAFLMALSITVLALTTLPVPRTNFVNPCSLLNISDCQQLVEGNQTYSTKQQKMNSSARKQRSVSNDLVDLDLSSTHSSHPNIRHKGPESQKLIEGDLNNENDLLHSVKGNKTNTHRLEDVFLNIMEHLWSSRISDIVLQKSDRIALMKKRVFKRDIPTVINSKKRSNKQESSLTSLPEQTKVTIAAKWTGLVSLVGFVGSYEIGFGAGTWLVLAEIFPSAVRGRAIAIATVFNWGTNLLVSSTFLDIINAVGVSWTFLPYGVISALAGFFVFVFVPETKGKTLEQIGQDFKTWSCISRLSCCKMSPTENENGYSIMEVEDTDFNTE